MHEELGILTAEVRARKAAQEALLRGDAARLERRLERRRTGNGNGHTNGGNGGGAAATAEPEARSRRRSPTSRRCVPAKLVGLDLGPACEQCGGMMQRTGSCYTCSSCGNNTGCG